MRGLHGVRDNPAQVGAERLERHLVAQPGAEALECPGRVIAAAVEAPVNECLDPPEGGPNSAATASVEPAIAKSDSGLSRNWSSRTLPRYAAANVIVSAP